MRLDSYTTPAWAEKIAGPKDADGNYGGYSVADLIHDEAFHCEMCAEAFSEASDCEDGLCEACGASNGYWVGFNPAREYGTVSV